MEARNRPNETDDSQEKPLDAPAEPQPASLEGDAQFDLEQSAEPEHSAPQEEQGSVAATDSGNESEVEEDNPASDPAAENDEVSASPPTEAFDSAAAFDDAGQLPLPVGDDDSLEETNAESIDTYDSAWEDVDAIAGAGDVTRGASSRPRSDSTADPRRESNPRLQPGPDGTPPMARPVVLVSLATEQVHAIVDRALNSVRKRDAKLVEQIADYRVKLAFWEFRCEQRALSRSYR